MLPVRPLGHSELEVPICGLGCNNFGGRVELEGTRAVVDEALAEGVTFLDTADIYGGRGGSETLLGQVLDGRRDQVVLATKFGMDMGDGKEPRGSAEYIRQAIEASLKRLRTDVIDLYWYHQPDGATPITETLEALHELVQAGTVRAIGASNFSAEQLREADTAASERNLTRFCAVQNEYSLLKREAEREVLPVCEELGIAFVPYFPLASGLLTGKYRPGESGPQGSRLSGRNDLASQAQWSLIQALSDYARERGTELIDVAIGALLERAPVASVIAGATKPDQVRRNAQAAQWSPSDADLHALTEVLDSHPV